MHRFCAALAWTGGSYQVRANDVNCNRPRCAFFAPLTNPSMRFFFLFFQILLARSKDFDQFLYVLAPRAAPLSGPRRLRVARAVRAAAQCHHQGPLPECARPHPAPVAHGPALGPRRAVWLHGSVRLGPRARATHGRADRGCIRPRAGSMRGEYRLPGITQDKQILLDYAQADARTGLDARRSGKRTAELTHGGLGCMTACACTQRCPSSALTSSAAALAPRSVVRAVSQSPAPPDLTHVSARAPGPAHGALPQIFANNVNCLNETTPIYGFEVAPSPAVGESIMIGYDYGITCGPVYNLPPASETGRSRRGRARGRGERAGRAGSGRGRRGRAGREGGRGGREGSGRGRGGRAGREGGRGREGRTLVRMWCFPARRVRHECALPSS